MIYPVDTAIQRLNNLGLVFESRNNEQYNAILFQGLFSNSGGKAPAEWLNSRKGDYRASSGKLF